MRQYFPMALFIVLYMYKMVQTFELEDEILRYECYILRFVVNILQKIHDFGFLPVLSCVFLERVNTCARNSNARYLVLY